MGLSEHYAFMRERIADYKYSEYKERKQNFVVQGILNATAGLTAGMATSYCEDNGIPLDPTTVIGILSGMGIVNATAGAINQYKHTDEEASDAIAGGFKGVTLGGICFTAGYILEKILAPIVCGK